MDGLFRHQYPTGFLASEKFGLTSAPRGSQTVSMSKHITVIAASPGTKTASAKLL
jgi:hypothetical protein